jgi:2-polyprenyl-3-methyl-5-hydroxy-6-metoxy-1,4-benzoquinol methylase
MSDASRLNSEYYEELTSGRRDYWRKMAAPRHRVATLVSEIARAAPRRVADLGCGDGSFLEELSRALPGASLAGIDLSAAQIEANRSRMSQIGWHVHNLDRDTALPDELRGSFDAVVAMELVEHLDHPQDFLRAATELTTPGGALYLSTQSGPVGETERRVGHRRHYTAEQMHDLLHRSGWRPVRIWNTGFPFHDLSKWYANRDPDESMARFGDQAYGWRENLICAALRLAFRLNSKKRGAQLFAFARRAA